MAKLIALALAFAALVAFATAHTTIVTTSIEEDEYPLSDPRQCSRQLQGQRLNQCRMFLQQGQNIPFPRQQGQQQQQQQEEEEQILEQCCQQLQNVDEQCQCEAVEQVFREVQQQQQQQQQQQFGSSQQSRQLKQKAQILPNVCNLQSRRRCQIESIRTTVTEISSDRPFGKGSQQQCREREIERPVKQCQRYVEEQLMRSPRALMMSVEHQQGLKQCCNELQNVKRECQCEAVMEVADRVIRRQPQQQGRQQQEEEEEEEIEIVRRVVKDLPNQCELEVQQCNIPY